MLTDKEMAEHFMKYGGRCNMMGQCHEGGCPIETRGIREGKGKAS